MKAGIYFTPQKIIIIVNNIFFEYNLNEK